MDVWDNCMWCLSCIRVAADMVDDHFSPISKSVGSLFQRFQDCSVRDYIQMSFKLDGRARTVYI